MPAAMIKFKDVKSNARFRHNGVLFQKCGPNVAYPVGDSDEPDEHIFTGTENCIVMVPLKEKRNPRFLLAH